MKEGAIPNSFEHPGEGPSEQWIQSVMQRVRAEAESMPHYAAGHRADHFGGIAGIAAAAAVVIALLGWGTLPSAEELAWKAQTGGCISEYLLFARK